MEKEKLCENVLKSCEEEYKDNIGTFNQLDVKSQQVAAFSGVLLGFLISFCKKEYLNFLYDTNSCCIPLSIVAILLLIISISISIYSMRIVKIIGMPIFSDVEKMFNDLYELNDKEYTSEHYSAFLREKIIFWSGSFASISGANTRKANGVFLSQIICGCALISLGFVAMLILISYI